MTEIVSLTERRVAKADKRGYWVCSCGNEDRFRIYEDGEIACMLCGSSNPNLRAIYAAPYAD